MRIQTIHIAGYGRFADKSIEFAPGLQVIIGPNEKGKSTIRGFVSDMLFGQKCNDAQRIYEESNELRAPWNGCEMYGGSLTYTLDDGRAFEVVRNFDKNRESIQVRDCDSDTDITDGFTRHRNRELDFARQHLGLSKEVFLSTATISHLSLTDLGDSEALNQIRETLLTLTDSGGGAGTVEGALNALANRIAAIGRPDVRNKPLPLARQQLAALEKEYRDAREQQVSLRALATARKTVLDATAALQREKRAAEAALRTHACFDDLDRLEQVEEIQAQLDAAARQCAVLHSARDFPLDLDGPVQAAHGSVEAAARQVEKTRAQCDTLRKRVQSEQPAGAPRSAQVGEFPAALEQQINETQATMNQLQERILEAHTLVHAARERMEDVQRQLADLPDFSRLSADPVEWLSQLASSFSVALRARDEECALRAAIRKDVEALEDANAPYDGLFASRADFSELAREYEVQFRLHEEQVKRQASELHTLQVSYDETKGESRAFLPLGLFCLAVTAILAVIHFTNDAMETIYFALLTLFVGVIFLFMHLDHKGRLKRLDSNIGSAAEELSALSARERDSSLDIIAEMLREADLDTVRELEARYDHYKSNQMELKIRREALAGQEEKAVEAEERIPQLLDRFKDTFAKAGETIEREKDVPDAAGRAIARYQAYREAKRRATSNRAVLERHEAELKRLEMLATQTGQELAALEKEAREFVLDFGMPDAGRYDSVKDLISAYRQTVANSRELQGRQDMLAENLRNLERQLGEDTAELERCRKKLDGLYGPHGFSSIEQWNAQAGAAREYRNLARQAGALEDRLASVLGKYTVLALRERVARYGDVGPRPEDSRESLEEMIARLNEAIDRKIQEEHALHVQLTQQSVRTRSMAEIEEEIALAEAAVQDLEAEVEATSYAMAVMESVAQDKHAEIAPRLAEEASRHLAAITRGSYAELFIGRDLRVSVRIPETEHVNETPEKSLSKGTVDQIYLALRLAFVQCLSENSEGIPMLLDDPFANYDDERLESTMALIADLVGQNQILLFTCREDVVSVAEKQNATIIRL